MNIREGLLALFGLDMKTDQFEPEIDQIVRKERDDGAAEVITNTGGVFFQEYDNILDTIKNEQELIQYFRKLATCPEVDTAIEEIVNDVIVYSKSAKYPVKLNLTDVDLSESIKKKITEEFDNILGLLEFNKKAHLRFRQWYIDGRLPYYITVNEKNTKAGIEDLMYIDPIDIKKVRIITLGKNENNIDVVKEIQEFYVYLANSRMSTKFVGMPISSYTIEGNNVSGAKLYSDSVVLATSGIMDENGVTLSHLHKAIKPANQMNEMEDAMLIYRIARAPSRRAFYVDVSNLPTKRADEYLQAIMAKHRNKISYDSSTGKINSTSSHKSMLEDYWLPRGSGGKGTEISTISGSDTFNNIIEEVQYYVHKLYLSLNVPVSRLDSESTFSFGKDGEITRDEVKFSKFVDSLRTRFAYELFSSLLKTQCILKNIFSEKDWDELIEDNLKYMFEEDSYFAELKDLDVLQHRMEVLDSMNEHVNSYYSKAYIREHVLFQTDEEIEEMKKQRETEEKEEPTEDEDDKDHPSSRKY